MLYGQPLAGGVISGGGIKQTGSYQNNTNGSGSVVIVPTVGGGNGQMYMSVGPQLGRSNNQGLTNAQLQMSAGHGR